MKITKRQLKRIIREEGAKIISEAEHQALSLPSDYNVDAATQQIEEILNDLWNRGVADNRGLKIMLKQLIDDIDSGFIGEPR